MAAVSFKFSRSHVYLAAQPAKIGLRHRENKMEREKE